MYQQGQKEEGSKMVKSGLVLNLKSFISWHVFGILHRLKNDYATAIKGYTNALKLNSVFLIINLFVFSFFRNKMLEIFIFF